MISIYKITVLLCLIKLLKRQVLKLDNFLSKSNIIKHVFLLFYLYLKKRL